MTLITGIIGAAFYWLTHYSTLRRFSEKNH